MITIVLKNNMYSNNKKKIFIFVRCAIYKNADVLERYYIRN